MSNEIPKATPDIKIHGSKMQKNWLVQNSEGTNAPYQASVTYINIQGIVKVRSVFCQKEINTYLQTNFSLVKFLMKRS